MSASFGSLFGCIVAEPPWFVCKRLGWSMWGDVVLFSANSTCPNCGGPLAGDGYRTVLHCENADMDKVWECEPDASPVYCDEDEEPLVVLIS